MVPYVLRWGISNSTKRQQPGVILMVFATYCIALTMYLVLCYVLYKQYLI